MSYLEELENNKKEPTQSDKTPRELWESCFKYFKHFISIISKNKSEFEAKFNYVFLNTVMSSKITGPYEITRVQNDNQLKLEIRMQTHITKAVKINRKDQRSADLLKLKLSKDGILSNVKNDSTDNFFVELNQNIPSIFRIILLDNKVFHIEYKNICSSTNRSVNLVTTNINEEYMDKVAKYILGQNPSLYTEAISNQEITKIRNKIELNKQKQRVIEEEIEARIKRNEELEAIKKANTLKEKSKRYFSSQSRKLKEKLIDKINHLKSK